MPAYSKETFPDALGESSFLVLPINMSDFKSHEALTRTVLQYFHKVIDLLDNNNKGLCIALQVPSELGRQ